MLVVPEPHMAVLQPPIVPRRARHLAGHDCRRFGRAAIGPAAVGSEHFEQTPGPVRHARQTPGAVPDIGVPDAQLAMYDGRFADAVQFYAKLLEQRPDDPLLRCQWRSA